MVRALQQGRRRAIACSWPTSSRSDGAPAGEIPRSLARFDHGEQEQRWFPRQPMGIILGTHTSGGRWAPIALIVPVAKSSRSIPTTRGHGEEGWKPRSPRDDEIADGQIDDRGEDGLTPLHVVIRANLRRLVETGCEYRGNGQQERVARGGRS